MGTAVSLSEVEKSFGDVRAVQGVAMEVAPGTVFGLLGPNGAGKTTTIRMIMDIIAPDRGEILFDGRRRTREDLHRVGYLPEERGLYRRMSVFEHLVFLGELHGLPRKVARSRVDPWLERVQLTAWRDRKVEELSKGMQQKIQLVGTLLHDPELVILDEPFSGLDPINQGLFKEILAELEERGRTILLSTHVMEQAEKLCDHICLIAKGRTILQGDLRSLKRALGGNSFRLVFDDGVAPAGVPPEVLRTIEGVEQAVPFDTYTKLLLAPQAEGSEVLRRLVERFPVREFRSEEPELEEIFIKAVRDAS
jgi:ABC-2 type transport system ATP-binding protein